MYGNIGQEITKPICYFLEIFEFCCQNHGASFGKSQLLNWGELWQIKTKWGSLWLGT